MKLGYDEVIQGFDGPPLIHRWGARPTTINCTPSQSKEGVGDGTGGHHCFCPPSPTKKRKRLLLDPEAKNWRYFPYKSYLGTHR